MTGDSTYNHDHKSDLSGSAYSKRKRAELEEWTRIRDALFYVTLNKEVPSSYACSICREDTNFHSIRRNDCGLHIIYCEECEVKFHDKVLHIPEIWQL